MTKFITKGKGRKKRTFPIKKKKGVSVRSVSLQPKAELVINKKQIQLINEGKPATFSKALNEVVLRKKKDEIDSIADLDGRDDFDLVQVDTDVEFFLEYLGLPKDSYDGLFIKQKDGEVVEAYGFSGIIPDLYKSVDRLETPDEKLAKKFGTRAKLDDSWEKPMTISEQQKTLQVLDLIDGLSKGGLDKDGKKLQKELQRDLGMRKARLVDMIKHGDKVTIVNQRGNKITGRAVMKSALGDNSWVLNTGGAHGTPAIASDENVVKVVEGR